MEKVIERLQGDATLSGLVADLPGGTTAAITSEWPSEDTPMPYVSIQFGTAGTEEAFRAKGIYSTVDVHVFHEKKGAGEPLSTCHLILDRVTGNWLTNGGTPAHGLERWAPELSASGWTSGELVESGPRVPNHESGVYHFVSTFETLVSKRVSGP